MSADEKRSPKEREQVGSVLGKPVYRDQLSRKPEPQSEDTLHELFLGPLIERYRRIHEAELAPSSREVKAAKFFFDKRFRDDVRPKERMLRDQRSIIGRELSHRDVTPDRRRELESQKAAIEMQLIPPDEALVRDMVADWRLQKHLYEKFGGGRVLRQQAGLEAFDAMRRWIELQERNGLFKIDDGRLRRCFYAYWMKPLHPPSAISDLDEIRSEFLAPEWVRVGNK